MPILSWLGFGDGKIKDALLRGGVIIDVRSPGEFDSGGRIPDSINIPVDRIAINSKRILAMKHPVIFCCDSGHRAGQAVQMMRDKGMKEVYYGGDWERLLKIVNNL
jgi:rhodanese-related sulfurtransferase